MFNRDVLIEGKTSLSSQVGIGSKRQVDGLDEEIVEVSSERSIGAKQSKYISGFTVNSKFPVFEDRSRLIEGKRELILFLIFTILSLKKLMKSLLLRSAGIHGTIELWLFVRLAKVLNRNLGLFLFSSISDE